MTAYLFLLAGVIVETFATNFLKSSHGFQRILPTSLSLLFYAISFFFISKAMDKLPLVVVYAVWCGLGIVLVMLTGIFFWQERLTITNYVGVMLLLAGILLMNSQK